MPASFLSLFRKTARCPSSQTLLAYHRGNASPLNFRETAYIEDHLSLCDFCNAELQLLTRHQNDSGEYPLAEMPAQLRRLAEDFLRRGAPQFNRLRALRETHQLSH